jgi:hypothetical protein
MAYSVGVMGIRIGIGFLFGLLLCVFSCRVRQESSVLSQYPSPMVEFIRPHTRVGEGVFTGERSLLPGIFHRDPVLLIPASEGRDSVNLLIHFHGSEAVVGHAVQQHSSWVGVSVNLGSGSRAYGTPLEASGAFEALLAAIAESVREPIRRVYLSGFSAGYGAVRAVLRSDHYPIIDGVLLLDGLHAGYVPDRMPLSEGGTIDDRDLDAFQRLAADAMLGRKQFILTHSSVFPGTYASTTECADFLLRATGITREPVLREGSLGMQQVGQSQSGNFQVLAFAGNTAPDHIDHLHALFYFMKLLE